MTRFFWPASLAETTSFWLNERSCLKAVRQTDIEEDSQCPTLVSTYTYVGIHAHILMCVYHT